VASPSSEAASGTACETRKLWDTACRKLIASFVDKSCPKLRKWITKRYGYLTMLRWITLRLYGHKVILFCTEVECG